MTRQSSGSNGVLKQKKSPMSKCPFCKSTISDKRICSKLGEIRRKLLIKAKEQELEELNYVYMIEYDNTNFFKIGHVLDIS